ncbi:hypothetical protein CANINC_003223 [Pichia inconspicua]|uniref:Magnesium transporter n=1 Tax=Pichia inconspicua TaxID=52247 RepID=A0A4T0X0F7_9ASCO|nr:hypothetical protein CANINC_003223 [[Candida] inconspicua]
MIFLRPLIRNYSNLLSTTAKVFKPITPDVSTISCTVVDINGTVRAVSKKFSRATFLQQNKLFPRDLRKIDSSNVDVAPSIAVRSNGILVNLLHIKTFIKRNEVLIFDTASPEAAGRLSLFMYDLESKLKTRVVHSGMLSTNNAYNHGLNQPFEFKVLECVLVNVMAILETELREHVSKVEGILNELDSQIDRGNLKDLLVYSKALQMFYQKSLLIKNTLDELLDNDEDLESIYLTENYEIKQMIVDDEDTKTSPHQHQQLANRDTGEIEMLLEAYYKQCDEIVQQAETMLNDIKSTEDIVNIILDANRNSLMVFELRVAIFTLGFTIATILPAFYGMNLKNYIEESNIAFVGIVSSSLVMGALMSVIYLRRLHKLRRMSMISSKQLDKFDENTKQGLLESIRLRKAATTVDKRRKLEKEVVWKWLMGNHK